MECVCNLLGLRLKFSTLVSIGKLVLTALPKWGTVGDVWENLTSVGIEHFGPGEYICSASLQKQKQHCMDSVMIQAFAQHVMSSVDGLGRPHTCLRGNKRKVSGYCSQAHPSSSLPLMEHAHLQTCVTQLRPPHIYRLKNTFLVY